MATHKLALIIKNPSNDSQFLLLKQSPPPKFDHDEYDSFIDSDLWDLPSTKLSPLEGESNPRIVVEGEESCSERLELCKFDLNLALNQVLEQVGFGTPSGVQWKLCKCVEEPEFGPGLPVQTVYVVGILGPENGDLQGLCKWMSLQSCLSCLLEVKPSSDRVGPLVVIGLVNDSLQPAKWKIPPTLNFQEYPLGVKLVPMGSRTAKPFHTTNLVVFSPESVSDGLTDSSFVSHGDALIVDPGCRLECHKEKIVPTVLTPFFFRNHLWQGQKTYYLNPWHVTVLLPHMGDVKSSFPCLQVSGGGTDTLQHGDELLDQSNCWRAVRACPMASSSSLDSKA
ncbi:hypothetical protein TEA_006979 [Camellia sinensis var. sinensis]|uniref:Uncharacterized protein n=1 Tax=Camellia sinensis var. sinensis TaxID=542762 RepID=A0A4S4EA27_CAMSN|nr:hypothetical protein TEA_006979 [Camellia sinensis var. sinensis]